MKKINLFELLILAVCVTCIFISEYIFLVKHDSNQAIFIGLWPPTILGFLNFIKINRLK